MKRIALLLAPLALLACQDTTEPSSEATPEVAAPLLGITQTQGPERVYPGRLVARFRQGVDEADVARTHGLTVDGRGPRNAFVLLRGAVGSERALAARLRGDDRVVWAEPDYLRQPTAIDPKLWAFYNPGGLQIYYTTGRYKRTPVTSFVSLEDADEDNIEGYAAGGSAVVIGSIDTGVDFEHQEFWDGQLIEGWDWYSGDADPSDTDGHGTHTTGTMVGATVGVAGVSGAGANVKVYVQRVCGPLGCPLSAIASAIRAAADVDGMVAMNLSLGGSTESDAEREAIAYAVGKGVLVIASAGNGGTGTVGCPACDPLAISVAASNWQDELTYYSNWGDGLDITAPGGQMYSNTTEEGGIYSAYLGGGYAYLQGTSMAAPQVTGTAGIVASKAGLTGTDLRARLLGTADDLGASGYDTQFGYGRLNSYKAVTTNTLDEGGSGGGGSETLTAAFTTSCGNSDTCTFDGTGSTAATGWTWDIGGTLLGTTAIVTHTFTAAGTYLVTLEVRDGTGATDSANRTVTCAVKGKLRCN
jgi:subtilisin family serine protease